MNKEHADNFEKNIDFLKKSGVEFKKRETSCLFREAGKPRVDFYPHTGRWRVVGVEKFRTKGGGAKVFLVWYEKQGTKANWQSNASTVGGFHSDLGDLLERKKKLGIRPDLCPSCLKAFDKKRPVKIHRDTSNHINYWEYSHCDMKLIIWNYGNSLPLD